MNVISPITFIFALAALGLVFGSVVGLVAAIFVPQEMIKFVILIFGLAGAVMFPIFLLFFTSGTYPEKDTEV